MSMDQRFGLISLHLPQVVVITTKVSILENFPIYSIQVRNISEEFCGRKSGMAVSEDETDADLIQFW
jgi:hypothetical protein